MKKDEFKFYRDRRSSVEIMKEISEKTSIQSVELIKMSRKYLERKETKNDSCKGDEKP